jgi:hypothetical protein
MKNLMLSLVLVFIMANIASAQYPVVTNSWVPYMVPQTVLVPQNITVSRTYTAMVPVTVPTVQYYMVPFAYYPPTYQPVVMMQGPCLFCPGRFYYVNSLNRY